MRTIFASLFIIISFGAFGQNSITDERDGITYEVFEIGGHVWFKSNLKYKTPTSWCNENPDSEACKYGNYYYPTDLINVCPTNYRVPTWKEYKQAIKEIENFYELSDSLIYSSAKLPLYKKLRLESEGIINLTLIGDSNFFDMSCTGWVEGDKWVPQNQATVWIIHEISNTPQPHIHVNPNDIIMHSHGHNIIDKPKNLRRFAVRCVSDND
jgi:uncharacterized protein (TIGR02145 family)